MRNSLFQFYETILKRMTKFISGEDEKLEKEISNLETDLFDYRFVANSDGVFSHMQLPKGNIINHQSLHSIYSKLFKDAFHKRYRLEILKKDYLNIMNKLEMELEERGVKFTKMDTLSWKREF